MTENAPTLSNPAPSSIELDDIENLIRVIDFAADNGAFKGWDTIRQVLALRDRVNGFVQTAREVVAASVQPETTD